MSLKFRRATIRGAQPSSRISEDLLIVKGLCNRSLGDMTDRQTDMTDRQIGDSIRQTVGTRQTDSVSDFPFGQTDRLVFDRQCGWGPWQTIPYRVFIAFTTYTLGNRNADGKCLPTPFLDSWIFRAHLRGYNAGVSPRVHTGLCDVSAGVTRDFSIFIFGQFAYNNYVCIAEVLRINSSRILSWCLNIYYPVNPHSFMISSWWSWTPLIKCLGPRKRLHKLLTHGTLDWTTFFVPDWKMSSEGVPNRVNIPIWQTFADIPGACAKVRRKYGAKFYTPPPPHPWKYPPRGGGCIKPGGGV